jgi:hypothetical protein
MAFLLENRTDRTGERPPAERRRPTFSLAYAESPRQSTGFDGEVEAAEGVDFQSCQTVCGGASRQPQLPVVPAFFKEMMERRGVVEIEHGRRLILHVISTISQKPSRRTSVLGED